MAEENIALIGTIEKIIFPKSRNRTLDDDFIIAILKSEKTGQEVTFKGNMCGVREKEKISITGTWIDDKKYGLQVNLTSWERPVPSTKEQAYELLKSSAIKGCGEKTAKLIVDALGDNTIERIEQDGESCLISIKGIGKINARKIITSLGKSFSIQNIVKSLGQYGVTVKMAAKLFKEFGSNAIETIKNNPYELICLNQVGFHDADTIAKNLGVSEISGFRCEAAIIHVLKELGKDGHCYQEETLLISESLKLLNKVSDKKINNMNIQWALESLYKRTKVKIEDRKVYLRKIYEYEQLSAIKLGEIMKFSGEALPKNRIAEEIVKYQKKHQFILNSKQQEAIYSLFSHNVLILTGGPGTGKTATTKAIVDVYKKIHHTHNIALCAPTGRASQKLSEVVGMEAKTVHRLLNWGVRASNDDEDSVSKCEKNSDNPLNERLFIVDEMSMTDIHLFHNLIVAIENGSRVLFVGDPDQLPSVGAGAVLRDLINSPIPHVRLTEIYRQAKNSMIIENAHRVNSGKQILIDPERKDCFFIQKKDPQSVLNTILAIVKRLLDLGYKATDMLVLAPMKKGIVGTININEAVRNLVNPPHRNKKELIVGESSFRIGDVIIQNAKNNVERDLYNGSMGLVKDVCKSPNSIDEDTEDELGLLCSINNNEVWLSREDIKEYKYTTAYCITTHKSQGGQAKVVITPIVTSHFIMLTRNIVYTAMTRAEEKLIMVGQKKALGMAVRNVQPNLRKTFLAERIIESIEPNSKKILNIM